MNKDCSVKLYFNEEVRRFPFSGISFSDLKAKCVKMSNQPDNVKVVLKYEDPEGDYVTLSSDSEFEYALSLSRGSVVRIILTIDNGAQTSNVSSIPPNPYETWRSLKKRNVKWQNKSGSNKFMQ